MHGKGFKCLRCSETRPAVVPADIEDLILQAKAFEASHLKCKVRE